MIISIQIRRRIRYYHLEVSIVIVNDLSIFEQLFKQASQAHIVAQYLLQCYIIRGSADIILLFKRRSIFQYCYYQIAQMKPIGARELIAQYQQFFTEALPVTMELRRKKQWAPIIELLQEQVLEFEKLPATLKSKVDQFAKCSLVFFLAEAQFHQNQQLTAEGLLSTNTDNQKINRIKAKTYYLLYKQTKNVKHLETSCEIAKFCYPQDHKGILAIQQELVELQKKLKFQQLNAIPDFELFKQGIEFTSRVAKVQQKKIKIKTLHLEDLERMATEQSTLDPSKRIKTNPSALKSERGINLFISSTVSTKKVNHQSMFQKEDSELKSSFVVENQPSVNRYQEIMLARPYSARILVPKTPGVKQLNLNLNLKAESEVKKPVVSAMRQSARRSYMRTVGLNSGMRGSSRREFKDSQIIARPLNMNKSIQVDFSKSQTIESVENTGDLIMKDSSVDDPQSQYSIISQQELAETNLDVPLLMQKLRKYLDDIQKKAAKLIQQHYKSFIARKKRFTKQKQPKSAEVIAKPKQNFTQLVMELGAVNNLDVEEKVQRIKQILHVCQVLDQSVHQSWQIWSKLQPYDPSIFHLLELKWQVFKRLKSQQKIQKNPEIIKLYRENPAYKQVIDIWRSGIEGNNAIFVLRLRLLYNFKNTELRLHYKNFHLFAKEKEIESLNNYHQMVEQLLKFYMATNNTTIKTDRKVLKVLQRKGQHTFFRSEKISQQLVNILSSEFIFLRSLNGYKFRKAQNAREYITLLDEHAVRLQIYKGKLARCFKLSNISWLPQEVKKYKGQPMKNSSKSLSEIQVVASPNEIQKNSLPKSMFHGLRAMSIDLQEEIFQKRQDHAIIERRRKTMGQPMRRETKRQTRLENYFNDRGVVQQQGAMFDEPVMWPFQHMQLLMTLTGKYGSEFWLEAVYFQQEISEEIKGGRFRILRHRLNSRQQQTREMEFDEFLRKYGLSKDEVDSGLKIYRDLNFRSKMIVSEINSQEMMRVQGPAKKVTEEQEVYYPDYDSKCKLERRSVIHDLNQISMSHYYIFQYKTQNKPRIQFKLKQDTLKQLYVYRQQQPVYIIINSQHFFLKLQRLFRLIITRERTPDYYDFNPFKAILQNYILKQYKQIGCCRILGFQEDTHQKFNYQFDINSSQDIYSIVIKSLISNARSEIRNVIRTYCRVDQFTLVSKIKNMPWRNLMLLTQFIIQDLAILQVIIYPLNNRLKQHKTFLNHHDLHALGILDSNLERKAAYLQQVLLLGSKTNHRQLQIQLEPKYLLVSKLHDSLADKGKTPLFRRQKHVMHLSYRKVLKVKNQFTIFSVRTNIIDYCFSFLIYVPDLCKQYVVNLRMAEMHHIGTTILDSILPNQYISNYEAESKDMPISFNSFVRYFQRKYFGDDGLAMKRNSGHMNVQPASQTRRASGRKQSSLFSKSSLPQRVSSNYQPVLRDGAQALRRISRFDCIYDMEKLAEVLKQLVLEFSSEDKQLNQYCQRVLYFTQIGQQETLIQFWDQLLENAEILLTKQNKYVLAIGGFRGILRQLGNSERLLIRDQDYQADSYIEQTQIEYASMFEKFSSVSLKESEAMNVYFAFKPLSSGHHGKKIINLKAQLRQLIVSFGTGSQVAYSHALQVLKQSARYFAQQINAGIEKIELPKYSKRSLISFRTNKKTLRVDNIVDSKSKFKFFYSGPLMRNVIVTILQKKEKFYFMLEEQKCQHQVKEQKTFTQVELIIPHIRSLIKAQEDFQTGRRLLQAFKNQLIVVAFEKFYKLSP